VNVPVMTSYAPTEPKVAPLKAGWLSLIVSVVTRALAPGTTPITAIPADTRQQRNERMRRVEDCRSMASPNATAVAIILGSQNLP
jgi:hypothetical protein